MFTTRPEIAGTFGVAASTHWIGTQVAMAVLEGGGNAFDAAAAAGFALQVAEPHLNGPGGDLPAIVHVAQSNRQFVVCGQGGAPGAASISTFRALGLDLVPGTGLLPIVVPGSFDAWCLMLRDWGTWELSDVLAYAIGYARRGIPVLPNIHAAIESVCLNFESAWPSSAAVFLPHGKVPDVGSLFRCPALADTWERLIGELKRTEPRGAHRCGARGVVPRLRRRRDRSLFPQPRAARRYRTPKSRPIDRRRSRPMDCKRGQAGDIRLAATTPCSNAERGARDRCLLQQLALLSGLGIADWIRWVSISSTPSSNAQSWLLQIAKLTTATLILPMCRCVNFCPTLTMPNVVNLSDRTSSNELRPGKIAGYTADVDARKAGRAPARIQGVGEPTVAGVGEPTIARLGAVRADTCHIDVIDRWGNMVSATPSGGWLQSSPVIPELGFCLSTRGQMFSLTPSHPNSLAPNKRPRTTLSPSFACGTASRG